MAGIVNFFDKIFYFFIGNIYLHVFKLVAFIAAAIIIPGHYKWLVGALFLIAVLFEFITYVNVQYALESISAENEQLKQQAMPSVVIATEVSQTDMESFGRLYLALIAMEGAPNRKFLENNIYELSKQTGLSNEAIRELYSKSYIHIAQYLTSSQRQTGRKIGFQASWQETNNNDEEESE